MSAFIKRTLVIALASASMVQTSYAQVSVPKLKVAPSSDAIQKQNVSYIDIVDTMATAISEQYPIEQTANDISAALRQALALGTIKTNTETDFTESINNVLWDSAHDLHLKVQSQAKVASRMKRSGGNRVPKLRRVNVNENSGPLGITAITGEMINADTALITITGAIYRNPDLYTQVFKSVESANNVILDLRKSPGGTGPGVLYFLSQFYDKKTHLYSNVSRSSELSRESWTESTPVSKRFAGKNLYVLTGTHTASGAEAVSFGLKNTRRAILVGEKTAGAGNAGAFLPLGNDLLLFLPIAQTVSANTGEPWEGEGITPHVTIKESAALAKALELIAVNSNEVIVPKNTPAKLTSPSMKMRPKRPPLLEGSEHKSIEEVVSLIDAYIKKAEVKDTFSGSILIADGNQVLYGTAVGVADKSTNRANTLDTPINLGSINKTFTGVAIGQLIEKDLLDVNQTIGEFLPNYKNEQVRDTVTIAQLLSHRSGITDFPPSLNFSKYAHLTEVSDLVALIEGLPLSRAPGSEFRYSNAGPWILGRVIEVVTKMDYRTYIEQNILKPTGMLNTGFFSNQDTCAAIARGYVPRDGQSIYSNNTVEWASNVETMRVKGGPAGGAYSSANDMLKFSLALQQNTLIETETLDLLTTPYNKGPKERDYGYLFGTRVTNGFNSWGHNGGAPGINADFRFYPELGYTIVVLSNYDRAASPIGAQIAHWLTKAVM